MPTKLAVSTVHWYTTDEALTYNLHLNLHYTYTLHLQDEIEELNPLIKQLHFSQVQLPS